MSLKIRPVRFVTRHVYQDVRRSGIEATRCCNYRRIRRHLRRQDAPGATRNRRRRGAPRHLSSAARTLLAETDFTIEDLRKLGDVVHNHKDIGASIASGSFRTEGMVEVPCSVKSLSGISNCYDEDLIVRAADVCLKERRRLVLMLRETPFHAGHISLMEQATRMGAIIMPPNQSFYNHPKSINNMVSQSVGRMLDLFYLAGDMVARLTGTAPVSISEFGPVVKEPA